MTAQQSDRAHLVRVGTLADLRPDVPTALSVGGTEILVVRVGDAVHAIGNTCSHAEAYLDLGDFHPESFEIECPLHVGRFDVRTGAATAAPCVVPVPSYRVVVDGADVLVETGGGPT